jgi:hypothetical protein
MKHAQGLRRVGVADTTLRALVVRGLWVLLSGHNEKMSGRGAMLLGSATYGAVAKRTVADGADLSFARARAKTPADFAVSKLVRVL